MKFNLQFFGEEEVAESVETPVTEEVGVAEQVGTEESGEDTPTAEADEHSVDMNAIYANARRRAEKEVNDRINAEIVRRFGSYKTANNDGNISTFNEYIEALDAQAQAEAKERITSQGIDEKALNDYIENLPAVKRANEICKQQEQQMLEDRVLKDVSTLHELDETINTIADVPEEVLEYVKNGGANNIVDAYKILNYGKWTTAKAESARQAAINQAKGKLHLAPVNGVAVMNEEVEIPDSEKRMWEAMFPDKSAAELRKLYNKQL